MQNAALKTDRLLLRQWRSSDIEPFAAMCADPEVMRYIGSGSTRTFDQTRASIEKFEHEWDEHGFGLFAVERLEDGAFIGFTGLSIPTFLPEIMPAVEIGWRLGREYWGLGYATEAAKAVIEFGTEVVGLPPLVCIVQIENAASRRIAEKLGIRLERQTCDPSCDRLVNIYRQASL